MPLYEKVSLNDMTRALFATIESDLSSEEQSKKDLELLFESSKKFNESPQLKKMAIQFHLKMMLNDLPLTALDLAIIKKRPYADWLMTVIFNSNVVSETTKKDIFVSAIVYSFSYQREESFQRLLTLIPYGFDLNCSVSEYVIAYKSHKVSLPLTIAIVKGDKDVIMKLLLAGAKPNFKDKYLSANELISKMSPLEGNYFHTLLDATECLREARQDYKKKQFISMVTNLTHAIKKNRQFVHHYLKKMMTLALLQMNSVEDKTDYRFLRSFLSTYFGVLALSLQKKDEELQKEVLHFVTIYDEKLNSIFPVFSSKEEKEIFFKQPILPAIIEGAAFENTITVMKAKKGMTQKISLFNNENTDSVVSTMIESQKEPVLNGSLQNG